VWRKPTANHWPTGHIIRMRAGVLPSTCRDSLAQNLAKEQYPRYCQREGKRKTSASAAPAMTQYVRVLDSEQESGTSKR
jgi:hypothetical protein